MFDVDKSDGSVDMGESLYIKGQILQSASSASSVLHIDNLGSAGNTGSGPKDFIMYQDGSIDALVSADTSMLMVADAGHI